MRPWQESTYPEVAADETVDAGDDKKGDDELEHRGEYRVPKQHMLIV